MEKRKKIAETKEKLDGNGLNESTEMNSGDREKSFSPSIKGAPRKRRACERTTDPLWFRTA